MPSPEKVKKIYEDLKAWLDASGRFSEVIIGLPESIPQFRRALVTIYPARMEFQDSAGAYSLPTRLRSEMWIVYRGVRAESYIQAIEDLVFLMEAAQTDSAFQRAGDSSFLTSFERVTYMPFYTGKSGYIAVRYEIRHDIASIIV